MTFFVAVRLLESIIQIRGISRQKHLRITDSIRNLTDHQANYLGVGYNISLKSKDDINFSDSFQDTLVEFDYPELELPYESQVSLIILYTATTALALIGKLFVIIVLCFGNRSKTGLTKFLLNMSIADLFMACFCIPFNFTNTMLGHWIFGAAMCPVALFIQVSSVGISIFTNTAIGIDR